MTGEQRRGGKATRNNRSSGARGRGADSEFVNLELDKEQTAQYRQWREDVGDVEQTWTEVAEAGYRVNTKFDDYNECCSAFIIPPDGSDNSGFLLAGRGGTPYRAVAEALFKHRFVLKEQWGSFAPQSNYRDDPDF